MIRHFLDCSSGHLSSETWAWLDAELADDVLRESRHHPGHGIAGGRTRYGWFDWAAVAPYDGHPADLVPVFREARRQKAEYINFDCDAPLLPGLPVLHPDFAT